MRFHKFAYGRFSESVVYFYNTGAYGTDRNGQAVFEPQISACSAPGAAVAQVQFLSKDKMEG